MPRLFTRPGLHTGFFYAALFMATGVLVPFWPLWLSAWGLTPGEVGLYTALGMAVRVVAGLLVPSLADRLDRRRAVVVVSAALTAATYLAHLGITRQPALLVATLAAGTTMAGLGPIAEALGLAASRAWDFPYAQARGMGSAGFLAANLAAGALIARVGVGVALWWTVACMAAVAVLAVQHPGANRVPERARPTMRQIGRLVVTPTFAVFMAAVACLQSSHAMMYALGSVHWRDLGIGETEIGALWAASVAAEIAFLLTIGTRVVRRLGPIGALALAGAGGVVRWGAMMADPTGFWLWPIQGLHALTFAAAHLGAMAFIGRAVPDRYAAAAQGATTAMAVGGVTALAMMLAAALYPLLGGRTYAIGVVLSLAGIALAALLGRRWTGDEPVV
ncbi:MAG: MFS transporter [Amaricoccus sp.]